MSGHETIMLSCTYKTSKSIKVRLTCLGLYPCILGNRKQELLYLFASFSIAYWVLLRPKFIKKEKKKGTKRCAVDTSCNSVSTYDLDTSVWIPAFISWFKKKHWFENLYLEYETMP